MGWRFSREIKLARKVFLAGDAVPGFLAEPGMRRYIANKWPGSIYDDAAGSAAPPAPTTPGPPPEHGEAEWEAMREEDSDEVR